MSVKRKYSLPKLRAALSLLVSPDLGSPDVDQAIFDAFTGGVYWPEFSNIWREGSSPGVWREPIDLSRDESAAVAFFHLALPDFGWLMRSDIRGGFANVYPRFSEGHDFRRFSRYAASPPQALCRSTLAALIAIEEARW